MDSTHASAVELNELDADALRALLIATRQELRSTREALQANEQQLLSRDHEIQHLKLLIAKLERMYFGRKSEKIARQIDQLQLKLEELETGRAEQESDEQETASNTSARPSTPRKKRSRRPLPAHLPRETKTHLPSESCCPECGGTLDKLGEDVSEMLEFVPASFKVICHVRPKLSCTHCDVIVQAPAPSRTIERGLAGPGLLAHILTSKYCDYVGFPVM